MENYFSYKKKLVFLGDRVPVQALHRALQTRVPSGKWMFPTLQLLRPEVGYTCQEGSSPKLILSGVISIVYYNWISYLAKIEGMLDYGLAHQQAGLTLTQGFPHFDCVERERLFYPWLIVSFCLSTLLLFTCIETSNEFNGFDWVVFLGTRVWFFWSIVLLSFLGILAAYTTLLLVLGFLLCWEKNQLYLHWYHKILILITILFCSLLLWILLTYWKDRWLTIGLSLQIFSPYIHLSSISVMVLLSWPVAIYLIHLEGEARMRRFQITSIERKRNERCNMHTKLRALQVAIGLPFVLILLCLYVVPFGIYSACVQEKDKLGPKPNFFGHRGAPMLGPENTIMSFEKAVEYGAHGLESDVQIR
ncbi:glycerophosphodiester phosphodiesterase domain-containing protein 4-like [Bubalus bubalis]|uniref:glycerophosphodiester phosphodiesterase domain-containing protein 4-like n=1 Tax=Bubalus bubalis TaxID=89462 RepID=UPI001E1B6650|nr:glycerophosphodiester phosphodiesterase domain-containing protein 4-like [Bubalus bubalis]